MEPQRRRGGGDVGCPEVGVLGEGEGDVAGSVVDARDGGDDGAAFLALAEAWQAAAEQAEPVDRAYCLAAALFWYDKAIPQLNGLSKLKAQQDQKKIPAQSVQRR